MAIQFSLSYNANGDPVLVENTVTGTRTVINQPLVVSEYKPRFTSNQVDQVDQVDANTETNTDNQRSDIYKYINEMENNADDDQNLSFVQKQNLEAYTPEAVALRKKPKTTSERIIETVMKAVIPYAGAASAAVKALGAILPEESEEIKAIKKFYADPEQAALVESIPGMSNYNLVYGNPFNPSYGLSNAAQKRIDRINKTLEKKDSEVLEERKKKLQELIDRENKQQDEIRQQQINPVQNLTPQQKDYFRSGGGGQDSGNQNNNNQGGGADYSSAAETGAKAGFGYGL